MGAFQFVAFYLRLPTFNDLEFKLGLRYRRLATLRHLEMHPIKMMYPFVKEKCYFYIKKNEIFFSLNTFIHFIYWL